jgi:hypothetical protein
MKSWFFCFFFYDLPFRPSFIHLLTFDIDLRRRNLHLWSVTTGKMCCASTCLEHVMCVVFCAGHRTLWFMLCSGILPWNECTDNSVNETNTSLLLWLWDWKLGLYFCFLIQFVLANYAYQKLFILWTIAIRATSCLWLLCVSYVLSSMLCTSWFFYYQGFTTQLFSKTDQFSTCQ